MKSATLLPRLVIFREKANHEAMNSYSLASFPIGVWSVPPPALVTPISTSKLPSPPRKSPPHLQKSTSQIFIDFQWILLFQNPDYDSDDAVHPIAPPKRRKLSAFDNRSSLKVDCNHLKPKSASTSSPWTPQFSQNSISPFIFLEPALDQVFDENDNDNIDSVNDEQTLAKSLRKIAKAFECTNKWWLTYEI